MGGTRRAMLGRRKHDWQLGRACAAAACPWGVSHLFRGHTDHGGVDRRAVGAARGGRGGGPPPSNSPRGPAVGLEPPPPPPCMDLGRCCCHRRRQLTRALVCQNRLRRRALYRRNRQPFTYNLMGAVAAACPRRRRRRRSTASCCGTVQSTGVNWRWGGLPACCFIRDMHNRERWPRLLV